MLYVAHHAVHSKPRARSSVQNVAYFTLPYQWKRGNHRPLVSVAQPREIDPSAYSLSSNSKLVSESFDETNEIQSWQGGNTDFSDLGAEEPPAKIEKMKSDRCRIDT